MRHNVHNDGARHRLRGADDKRIGNLSGTGAMAKRRSSRLMSTEIRQAADTARTQVFTRSTCVTDCWH